MTDDFEALKAALKTTPAADPAARAAALARALENYDLLQGSPDRPRLISSPPPRTGLLMKGFTMLKSLNSRPLLAATTSAAALMIGFVVFLPLANQGRIAPEPEAVKEEIAAQPKPGKPVVPGTPVVEDQITDETAALSGTLAPAEAPASLDDLAQTAPAPAPATRAKKALADTGAAAASRKMDVATAEMAAPELRLQLAPAPMADTESYSLPIENTEEFSNAPANPVKITAEEPVSTFSIDVDTASYAVVRASLNAGTLPDPQSVRIEEMVNYFPYAYAAPEAGQPFRSTVTVMPTPWNPGTSLVHIGIQGALPAVENRPPLNLVFLIDTSGSMDEPNKLPLLKQSLALMLGQLRAEDQVAIVAYAGAAGQVLAPTPASNRTAILAALDNLAAGGSTAGAEGLELAYQTAASMAGDGEVSRILLATDGDFNVGIADPVALKTYIAAKRDTGIYLSVLGFGRGNLDDATMQALAQNGNGQAAYIDTLGEARKVLVDQLTGALYPIAANVKIQVEWNPATVAEYRLIGYETRALNREDFNNDRIDAGDIGAGTAVTAIYEITAPNSPARRTDPLRYGTAPAASDPAASDTAELGFLRLRHAAPGSTATALIETPILQTNAAASDDARFAAAIAGFGQLLTGATYLNGWGWDQAIALALNARGADDFGYRIEAVNLMRTAKALSGQ